MTRPSLDDAIELLTWHLRSTYERRGPVWFAGSAKQREMMRSYVRAIRALRKQRAHEEHWSHAAWQKRMEARRQGGDD